MFHVYRNVALVEGLFDGGEHECPLPIWYSVISSPKAHKHSRLDMMITESDMEVICQAALLN